MQCHHIIIVHKNTPSKFWFINDLSYPKGRLINDYILKCVTADEVISSFQELRQDSYL